MKVALKNLSEILNLIREAPEKNKLLATINLLTKKTVEDIVSQPPFYLRYVDDGPTGISPQVMSVTSKWDKLVILTEELNAVETQKLLHDIGKGRRNPRFVNHWSDSGYYPCNNIIRIK